MRWLVAALPVLVGCSTSTMVVMLVPRKYEVRPKDYPIQLFSAQLPTCPFEELGLVTAKPENVLRSNDVVAEALREKAREMGGDGVVHVGFVDSHATVGGTVIRFKDRGCARAGPEA